MDIRKGKLKDSTDIIDKKIWFGINWFQQNKEYFNIEKTRIDWVDMGVYDEISYREYLNNEASEIFKEILDYGVEVSFVHGEDDIISPLESLLESLGDIDWGFKKEFAESQWNTIAEIGKERVTANLNVCVLDKEGHIPAYGDKNGFVQNKFKDFVVKVFGS